MTPEELQDWLLREGIDQELRLVSQLTVLMEIDNLTPAIDAAALAKEVDWERLLLAGSILARSDRRIHEEAALRIATGALTLCGGMKTRDAGAVLLQKLGNQRAVELGENRELLVPGLDERLGPALRVESQRRRLESSVLVHSTGEQLIVNGFQRDFWSEADRVDRWLSVSAPTASGKTFLISKWLVDAVDRGLARVVIYLAPTRALVAEVEGSLSEAMAGKPSIEITSLPMPEKYYGSMTAGKRAVFVLTQERVHLLANAVDGEILVDLVVVDEAHKIGDNQRGVVLQDAVERLARANPALRVVFVSPGTENPEQLLDDAPAGTTRAAITSDAPTILQNVIYAEQVPRRPKEWALSLRLEGEAVDLGVLNLKSKPMSIKKRLAFIAAAAGERGGTLVYANGAAEAEAIALLISQLVEDDSSVSEELSDLADLIRKCVHRQYQLANVVERRVGFHYGNMPSLVRLEVERLFREGKIKFFVCTSTFFEGVNLACRTIVVRGPRKGKSNVMEPHDFWNLAGRAGRWGDEFKGNIVCVNPNDKKVWPDGVPNRAKYPIRRETDTVLARTNELKEYLSDLKNVSEDNSTTAARLEQVSAYLLSTFMRLGSITDADFSKRLDSQTVHEINEELRIVAEGVEVPVDIVVKYPGVNAVGLQRLLEAFRRYEGDIEEMLPASVESTDAYDRFAEIMKQINHHIFPAFLPPKGIPLFALIVWQWLRGYSLATIIRRRTDYHERHGQSYDIAKVIRETMELIEQIARFRVPKYFSAYIGIARLYLTEIGRTELIDDDIDIGIALDLGVSNKTLLSLMELGLSRISAVALYEKIALDNMSPEECVRWVIEREDDLDALELPRLVVREIRRVMLTGTREDTTDQN